MTKKTLLAFAEGLAIGLAFGLLIAMGPESHDATPTPTPPVVFTDSPTIGY